MISSRQKDAAVEAVEEGWASVLYISDEDDGQIHVVGKYCKYYAHFVSIGLIHCIFVTVIALVKYFLKESIQYILQIYNMCVQ